MEASATPIVPGQGAPFALTRHTRPLFTRWIEAKPSQPWRDIALSCLIAATGFFLASFQLTIGSVYVRLYDWGTFRAVLTATGIGLLIVALIVLVAAVSESGWVDIALAALCLGGVSQLLVRSWLRLRAKRQLAR